MRLALWGLILGSFGGCGVMVPLSPDYEEPPPDPCAKLSCAPGTHCVDGDCVGSADLCESVECDEGRVCVDGECVPAVKDDDEDGYPAPTDCDDHDPDVFPGGTRRCDTDCGRGLEECLGPEWGPCSAPIDCQCEPGEERSEPCGNCGTSRRRCRDDGTWEEDPSACENAGECRPNLEQVDPCGDCGSRRRTCGLDCHWEPYSDCEDVGECSPGEVRDPGCGPCGLGSQPQTCDDTCFWGPPEICVLDDTVCFPGQHSDVDCGNCQVSSSTCGDDCQWSPFSICMHQSCEGDVMETRECLCGGEEFRFCVADSCFGDWSGCATDDLLCQTDGEVLPCENGCGVTTCDGFCLDACSAPCSCVERDGTVHCLGDQWVAAGGCGGGVDAPMECVGLGNDQCGMIATCPD